MQSVLSVQSISGFRTLVTWALGAGASRGLPQEVLQAKPVRRHQGFPIFQSSHGFVGHHCGIDGNGTVGQALRRMDALESSAHPMARAR